MVGEALQERGILCFAACSVLALPWHVRSDCNPPVVEPLLGGAGMVTAHLCTRVPACARVCMCVPALPVGQRELDSRTGRDSGWCGTALLYQALAALGGALGGLEVQTCPWPATPPPLLAGTIRGILGLLQCLALFYFSPSIALPGQLSLVPCALCRTRGHPRAGGCVSGSPR